ncbi:hypothetical protein BC828DRAFT_407011 [Blastocladiella britannica]|nr:hypothetical protein BC828DRAFT_407011 [Blastocladiella britannica]
MSSIPNDKTRAGEVYERTEHFLAAWRRAIPEEMSAWAFPAGITTALALASLPRAAVKAPGLPPYLHLAGFATMFGVSTYAIQSGDALNGPSMATAWSLTYIVTNGWPAVKSRSVAPLAMLAGAAMQAGIYGITAAESFYWGDRDSMPSPPPSSAPTSSAQ